MLDLSKLMICNGRIHYKLRQQDDTFVWMTVADSLNMRLFVAWVQIHD